MYSISSESSRNCTDINETKQPKLIKLGENHDPILRLIKHGSFRVDEGTGKDRLDGSKIKIENGYVSWYLSERKHRRDDPSRESHQLLLTSEFYSAYNREDFSPVFASSLWPQAPTYDLYLFTTYRGLQTPRDAKLMRASHSHRIRSWRGSWIRYPARY